MIVYSVVEYASAALAITVRLSPGIGATLFAASDALIGLRIAHFTIHGVGLIHARSVRGGAALPTDPPPLSRSRWPPPP